MNRQIQRAAIVLGLAATAGAVYLAVSDVQSVGPDAGPGGVATVAALGGLAAALWLLYDHSRTEREAGSVPWSGADRIVDPPPEAAPRDRPLSGGELSAALLEARDAAREDREMEAGVAVVRPLLREAYIEAVAPVQDRAEAEEALDAGTWTDDPVAAAALSGAVYPPRRSLRRRLTDWLYPGRAVARRVRRAVDALSAAADDALPPVIGQSAPRQIPVYEPSLATLTVGPDGRTRRPDRGRPWQADAAPDPTATDRDGAVADAIDHVEEEEEAP